MFGHYITYHDIKVSYPDIIIHPPVNNAYKCTIDRGVPVNSHYVKLFSLLGNVFFSDILQISIFSHTS